VFEAKFERRVVQLSANSRAVVLSYPNVISVFDDLFLLIAGVSFVQTESSKRHVNNSSVKISEQTETETETETETVWVDSELAYRARLRCCNYFTFDSTFERYILTKFAALFENRHCSRYALLNSRSDVSILSSPRGACTSELIPRFLITESFLIRMSMRIARCVFKTFSVCRTVKM
jgi:hypothetical protein